MTKISICLAHNYSHFQKEFVVSTWRMQEYFWRAMDMKKYELSFIVRGGYALDKMRNQVVEDALKYKQDLLLFMDTDMGFEEHTIVRMVKVLEANPKFDAVTGIYTWKKPPYIPQLFSHFNNRTKKFHILSGFPLDKVFPIAGAGMGAMMVRAELFKRIKKPWFKFVEKSEMKELPHGCGEDLFFAWKCKPKLLCDPTLQAGHYDTRPVGLKNYIQKNKLKIDKGRIMITKKQMQKIEKEQIGNIKHK